MFMGGEYLSGRNLSRPLLRYALLATLDAGIELLHNAIEAIPFLGVGGGAHRDAVVVTQDFQFVQVVGERNRFGCHDVENLISLHAEVSPTREEWRPPWVE